MRKTEEAKKNTGILIFSKKTSHKHIFFSLQEIPTVTSIDLNSSRSITRDQKKSSSKSIYLYRSFFHFSHLF
jgi:hypothetical protein